MIDRTGKFLLALIAFGLWANVGVAVFHSTSAMAQDCNMSNVEGYLQRILNRVGDIGDHMPPVSETSQAPSPPSRQATAPIQKYALTNPARPFKGVASRSG
jgi:hypothetical protein